jgi:hypothetical protein
MSRTLAYISAVLVALLLVLQGVIVFTALTGSKENRMNLMGAIMLVPLVLGVAGVAYATAQIAINAQGRVEAESVANLQRHRLQVLQWCAMGTLAVEGAVLLLG